MAGPEIQANAIRTALRGLPLRSAPPWLDVLLIVLLALAVPLVALRVRTSRAALVTPLLALGAVGGAYLAFTGGIVVTVAAPLLALLVSVSASLVAGYLFETRERRRVDQMNAILEERVRERTADLREAQLELIERLSQAVELRDSETGDHIARISALAQRLALAIGLSPDEAELIRHASILHDVGKIGVPDAILLKPGPLNAQERLAMERHTRVGSELLQNSSSEVVQLGEVIARTHHEKWDGTGYPEKMSGEEIPLAGRITAVVDVFDALTSQRPYKQPWPVNQALDEIEKLSGTHFDPAVAEAFLRLQGRDVALSAAAGADDAPDSLAA
jgi:response regulator RpfG family c-di-GMP phosphodiesterase